MWPPNSSDSDKIDSYFSAKPATPFSMLLQFQEYLEHSWFYNRDDWVCKDCIFTFSWHFPALKQWVTLIDIKQWVSLIKKILLPASSPLFLRFCKFRSLLFSSFQIHRVGMFPTWQGLNVKSLWNLWKIDVILFYLLFKSWLYHVDMFPVAGPQCEITASIPCLETPASSFVYS